MNKEKLKNIAKTTGSIIMKISIVGAIVTALVLGITTLNNLACVSRSHLIKEDKVPLTCKMLLETFYSLQSNKKAGIQGVFAERFSTACLKENAYRFCKHIKSYQARDNCEKSLK